MALLFPIWPGAPHSFIIFLLNIHLPLWAILTWLCGFIALSITAYIRTNTCTYIYISIHIYVHTHLWQFKKPCKVQQSTCTYNNLLFHYFFWEKNLYFTLINTFIMNESHIFSKCSWIEDRIITVTISMRGEYLQRTEKYLLGFLLSLKFQQEFCQQKQNNNHIIQNNNHTI